MDDMPSESTAGLVGAVNAELVQLESSMEEIALSVDCLETKLEPR